MTLLTIITPTYNRAENILNLYKSLESQTNKDFCWLVVDDGSLDDTFNVISNLKGNASFEITCLRKENGGKHTALNYGIKEIKTELTMIVDSDDIITEDAVQNIIDIHNKYSSYKEIGSYTFLKGYSDGRVIVPIDKDEFVANYIDYRIKKNRPGDMAEIFKTKFLKKHPFPEFDGEKFISEDVVWIEMGKISNSVYVNKVIYICEYLSGGLTANDKPMKFASPCGSMLRGKQLMSKQCGIKANIKGAIIYNVYAREVKKQGYNNPIVIRFREKVLVFLTSLVAPFFYKKWNEGI